jgi:hypothetical protein
MADDNEILESVGHEIKVNPPKVLESTRRKFGVGRAKKQRVAILLSKARKMGASVAKAPTAHK